MRSKISSFCVQFIVSIFVHFSPGPVCLMAFFCVSCVIVLVFFVFNGQYQCRRLTGKTHLWCVLRVDGDVKLCSLSDPVSSD